MPDSKNFVTTESVIALISGLYIATGFAVVFSILFLLTSLDQAAKLARSKQVDIALNLETRYLKAILLEYSGWDEAYENLIVDLDETWIEGNSGQYLLNQHGFDFTLAIKANRQLANLSINDEVEGLEFARLMSGGLEDLIEESLQNQEGDEGSVAGYVLAGTDIYLVALSPFKDEKTEEIRPDSYLSLGRRLDAEYIGKLESSYELPGLRLANKIEGPMNSKVLLDASNQAIGCLTWFVEKPSLLIAPKVIGIVTPFFCLAIFLTRHFLKLDYADRIAFEERLYKEATCDPLTNISNRRQFMTLCQQEMAVHRRNGRTLAVALFDIDHFKTINDTYGHAMGDKALVHLVQVCSSELRESDIFGRIGGDEFAVILRETPIEEAVDVLNRVRRKIKACPIKTNQNTITITVSIGVAPMNDYINFDNILEMADVALYRAKKNGRNQVFVSV
ncbi:diguanylate cyclase [Leptolyngbya sp. CCNP1308]|uniref:sensor domain-containing diguanylate cyclase n=1 Tax=Leptolyngbya sp. CCNP1308 TaxID=3110255 RepID=UPI002B20C966|nr:diguanylate cyclase [Leptolyngbya sp. CCNP1308]MEA5447838.1 diguanylate cyclase [Leptolyngbya sp. CCNP1308]